MVRQAAKIELVYHNGRVDDVYCAGEQMSKSGYSKLLADMRCYYWDIAEKAWAHSDRASSYQYDIDFAK